jgi:hypothetical protein
MLHGIAYTKIDPRLLSAPDTLLPWYDDKSLPSSVLSESRGSAHGSAFWFEAELSGLTIKIASLFKDGSIGSEVFRWRPTLGASRVWLYWEENFSFGEAAWMKIFPIGNVWEGVKIDSKW